VTVQDTVIEHKGKKEDAEFHYRRKPAFVSFLLVYIFCFVSAYVLVESSPAVLREINSKVLDRLTVPVPALLRDIPYGIIFSLPFLLYGVRRLLWNIMSLYEFNRSEIRLLTGSLSRKERYFPVSEFFEISFRQSLIETPFGVGTLTLSSKKKGKRLTIKGVYRVKTVAEVLRSGLGILI
jgi:hypothetical protein